MTTQVLEQATEERLIRRRASAEEFWSLPESLMHIEYVDGHIVTIPTPSLFHQRALGRVFIALYDFVEEDGLEKAAGGKKVGRLFVKPPDVALPSGDVVQPDLFFLAAGDARRAAEEQRVRCSPPFAVEVLSSATAEHDTLTKWALYGKNGVREYWIVDAEKRTVAQLVLRRRHHVLTEPGESDTIKASVPAGFEMTVGELLGV
ncbi:MAG TPA: Uma2 family endonuclease [Pyrinomonadaceae bacterium]|jgi:Uma2 family endonuclease